MDKVFKYPDDIQEDIFRTSQIPKGCIGELAQQIDKRKTLEAKVLSFRERFKNHFFINEYDNHFELQHPDSKTATDQTAV